MAPDALNEKAATDGPTFGHGTAGPDPNGNKAWIAKLKEAGSQSMAGSPTAAKVLASNPVSAPDPLHPEMPTKPPTARPTVGTVPKEATKGELAAQPCLQANMTFMPGEHPDPAAASTTHGAAEARQPDDDAAEQFIAATSETGGLSMGSAVDGIVAQGPAATFVTPAVDQSGHAGVESGSGDHASPAAGNHVLRAIPPPTKEPVDVLDDPYGPEDSWDIVKASSITPVAQEWVWRGLIALGEVTVVAGQPGVGKSQFAALLAAHVSTGREWPDGTGTAPLGSALLFAVEDNLQATLTPRLMAAGADIERVEVVRGSPGSIRGEPTSFAAQLRRELGRRPDVRLVVLDPYDAVLQGINVNDQRQMRAVMRSLQQVAVETRTAVVLVAHLNKRSGGPATSRVMGSLALVAAARSCLLIAKRESGHVMVPHKQNLAASAGLSFNIIDWSHDGLTASFIEFSPEPVKISAEDLLGRPHKEESPAVGEAVRFLLSALVDGPLPAKELNGQAADQGIAPRTLERARKLVGVQASRGRDAICWLPSRTEAEANTANAASHPLCGGLGGFGGISAEGEIRETEGSA